MPDLRRKPCLHAVIVALVCATSLAANARLSEPPRFDGAGYAVLARSILQAGDYREIDHPDPPRHSHFPPGYPLALAALWSVTGPSFAWAHAASFACTLGATLLAWVWFRSWNRPGVALLMGLALAVNWRWAKDGTAIRSEPLFLLLVQAVLLMSIWVARRGGTWRAAVLGGLLGSAVLTRHVGLALVAAVCVDLVTRRRRREVVVALTAVALVLARWVAWLAREGRNTQVGLVPVRERLTATIFGNGLFYVRRLIDQIVGPFVEVATVFRPKYAIAGTIVAAIVSAVIVFGWIRLARRPRSRAAGLVPMFTLGMLLAWPFTEAGRFLVPLIPFLIAGLVEGFTAIAARLGVRRARLLAAILVLGMSLPYATYAIATHRADAERATHRDFDAACAWIAAHDDPPGPVLSRYPGEVFLRTGRTGMSPDGQRSELFAAMDWYGCAYVLVDDDRFFRERDHPELRFPADSPWMMETRFSFAGTWGKIVVYRARPPKLH